MSAPREHTPECRWECTTEYECEYRATHHYCPHPEHACDCRGADEAHPTLIAMLREAVDAPTFDEAVRGVERAARFIASRSKP